MAAFALEPTGPPPAPCGFPRCVLGAFHDGDHEFARAQRQINGPIYICRECGTRFVIYGEVVGVERQTCGSQDCILAASRREAATFPSNCRCPQRSYPHELSVHKYLRSEAYSPRLRWRWPWSLTLSKRLEPGTEEVA